MEMLHFNPPKCVFCSSNATNEERPLWDTILHESAGFFTVPTLGSIVPGWLLVVSRKHFLCAGALDGISRKSLLRCVEQARAAVSSAFGPATVFEHGPRSPGTPVGCGVDHLHMHVAPLPESLALKCTELYGTTWNVIQDLSELEVLHSRGVAYILVKEPTGSWHWAVPPNGVRQPLRRAIAHMVGMENRFDYRMDAFEENVQQTVRELSSAA